MDKMYHIGIDDQHGAKYAIIPGDPGRVEKIAAYLDDPRFYHQNREYLSWIGTLENQPVIVMSTGIGGPSAAIAVEELYQSGVRNFIRSGTCGAMQPQIIGGDVVIATGSIRMEGTSREYMPIEFPAVPDLDVTNALIAAAKKLDYTHYAGVVQCKDSFYGQHNPERMPVGYELQNKWRAWIQAGCLASEMESAAVFVISSVLHARAGGVFSVAWNQERARLGLSNPEVHDSDPAIRVSVEAVRSLILADQA